MTTPEERPTRDLSAERHLATISVLNLASAITMAVFAAMTLFGVVGTTDPNEKAFYVFGAIFFAMLGGVNALLWRGLPHHSPSARVMQVVVGFVALPGVPLGTLWGAYVLWALLRPRGARLFTAEYRKALLAEPSAQKARPHRVAVALCVTVGVLVALAGLFTARQELAVLLDQQESAARLEHDAMVDEAIERIREDGEPVDLSPADTDALLERLRGGPRAGRSLSGITSQRVNPSATKATSFCPRPGARCGNMRARRPGWTR